MSLISWSLRRQIFYVIILILFFSLFGFLVINPSSKLPPTCIDNIKNGDETGTDCGGSCALACLSEIDAVSVLWARSFKVVQGRYNAMAYLENHNKNTAVNQINYRFRFADANNIYIGKREGSTYVPPSGKFAVFEPGIDIGNSIPVYTTFQFTQTPNWVKVSEEKINLLQVLVSDINLINENTSPVLSATITNKSLFTMPEMSVVAILYDALGNAVSVSRTYLDSLGGEEAKDINFTWPEPLPSKVIAKEIIPMYNIFSVKFRQ